MKDFTYNDASNEAYKARLAIHERNLQIADLWWKYYAKRKVLKAAKKGKGLVGILGPARCGSGIGDILLKRKFHYNFYKARIIFCEVCINWV